MIVKAIKNFFEVKVSNDRIFGLDVLRAFAILEVVFAHGQTFLPRKFSGIYDVVGFDGVTLFFVLSGFLIGRILNKTIEKRELNGKTLLHFWNRRWWRTLPNYYLILILLLLHHAITKEFSIVDHLSYLFFAQNLFSSHPGFFGEAWSLSVEEWFYFLIPILLFLLIGKLKISIKKSIIIVFCLVSLLPFLFRTVKFFHFDLQGIADFDVGKVFRMQVFTRLDSIIYGFLGAYVSVYYPNFWRSNKLIFLILGILLILGVQISKNIVDQRSFYSCIILYSILPFSFLCLLPYFSKWKAGKSPLSKTISVLSLISYSMYLLNLNIVYWIIVQNIPWGSFDIDASFIPYIKFLVFWIFTVLLSIILYKYYEVPMMSFRRKKE